MPPTMTAIALHGLLEPNRSSLSRRLLKNDAARHDDDNDDDERQRAKGAPSPPYTLKYYDAAAKAKAKAKDKGFDALGAERRREAHVAGDYDKDVGFFDPWEMRSYSSSCGGSSSEGLGIGRRCRRLCSGRSTMLAKISSLMVLLLKPPLLLEEILKLNCIV